MSKNGPKLSIIDAGAVRDSSISHAEFRTLAAFGIYADKQGRCYPSLRQIGEDLGGITKQTVHGHVQRLVEAKYMRRLCQRKRKDGSDSTCEYLLLPRSVDPNPSSAEPSPPSGPEPNPPSGPEPDALNDPVERPSERKVIPLNPDQDETLSFEEMFDRWYAQYPLKKSKGAARKAFRAALKKTDFVTLLAGAMRYAAELDRKQISKKYTKHPSTWLKDECWLDEESKNDDRNHQAGKSGNRSSAHKTLFAAGDRAAGESEA